MVFFTQSNEKTFKISSDACFKTNLKHEKKLVFSIKTTAERIFRGRFYRSWNSVVQTGTKCKQQQKRRKSRDCPAIPVRCSLPLLRADHTTDAVYVNFARVEPYSKRKFSKTCLSCRT